MTGQPGSAFDPGAKCSSLKEEERGRWGSEGVWGVGAQISRQKRMRQNEKRESQPLLLKKIEQRERDRREKFQLVLT